MAARIDSIVISKLVATDLLLGGLGLSYQCTLYLGEDDINKRKNDGRHFRQDKESASSFGFRA